MELEKPRRDQDERATLVGLLDFYRAIILRKTDGLDHEQLNTRLLPSTLTLASLIKHLACVEDVWFSQRMAGGPAPEPWLSAPFELDDDWDLNSAADDSAEYLRELYLAACARSNAVIADVSLDTLAPALDYYGNPYNLRWVIVHLIEETARHAGHADFIRESIDGAVGD